MLWGKLYSFLSLIGLSFVSYKILIKLGKAKEVASWGAFLIFSSTLSLLSVSYAAQNDVLMMLALFIGIERELAGKSRQALVWFIYSFCIKPFTLFVLIPWWLYKDKSIIKTIRNLILLFLPRLIHSLIFGQAMKKAASLKVQNPMETVLTGILNGSYINLGGSIISIFLLFFVGICIWAYVSQVKERKESILFWMGLSFGGLICFSITEFYRGFIWMVFFLLLIIYYSRDAYVMVIIESFYSLIVLLRGVMSAPYYSMNYVRYLNYFWYPVSAHTKTKFFNEFVSEFLYQPIVEGILSFGFIFLSFLMIYYMIKSYLQREGKLFDQLTKELDQLRLGLSWRILVFLRIFIVPMFALISLYYYYS